MGLPYFALQISRDLLASIPLNAPLIQHHLLRSSQQCSVTVCVGGRDMTWAEWLLHLSTQDVGDPGGTGWRRAGAAREGS
jgi:hypothetical protein